MKLTILGGGGVWPTARQACGGYLLEHENCSVLIDPGYGVLPRLLALSDVEDLDAVIISHGHLDHCADLNPLLRARVLDDLNLDPLPVYAPRGALDQVLEVDRIKRVATGAGLMPELDDGSVIEIGPFSIEFARLPHHIRTVGMRVSADDHVVSYPGDSGECAERVTLAKDADLLVAEATHADSVPELDAPYLSSARQVARLALEANAHATVLTHAWPGLSAEHTLAAARSEGLGTARVALSGMIFEFDSGRATMPPASPVRAAQARRAAAERVRPGNVTALPRRALAV